MPDLVKATGLKTHFKVFFPQIIERKKNTLWSQTGLGSDSGFAKYLPCDLAISHPLILSSLIYRMGIILLHHS